MRIFLLISAFACSLWAQSFDFSSYSPSPRQIDGESYPRNSRLLYRGMTEGQFGPKKAIRAMLGDKSAHIESLYFTTIKKRLEGERFSLSVRLDRETEKAIQRARKDGDLMPLEASAIAQKISDQRFSELADRGLLDDYYFDYRSGSFIDWPNDVVYSSLIQPAAGTYGYQMAVIKETSPRSLDMNFFNYVENGLWHVYTRDVGEFVSSGYIASEDIIGYQLRDPNGHKGWHRIETFLVKRSDANGPYIEVYSGLHPKYQTLSSCMSLNEKKEVVHCDYRPGSIALTPPKNTDYAGALVGVLAICKNKRACEGRFKTAPINRINEALDEDIERALNELEIIEDVLFIPSAEL